MKYNKLHDCNVQIAHFLGFEADDTYGVFCIPENHTVLDYLDVDIDEVVISKFSNSGVDYVTIDIVHIDFLINKYLAEVARQACVEHPKFKDYPLSDDLAAASDGTGDLPISFFQVLDFINWLSPFTYHVWDFCMGDLIDASGDVLVKPLPDNWLVLDDADRESHLLEFVCEDDEGSSAEDLWDIIVERAETAQQYSADEFFIFGESATIVYNREGFKGFLTSLLRGELLYEGFKVIEFNDTERPSIVLRELDGWHEYCQISECEFSVIKAVGEHIGKGINIVRVK